MAAFCELHEKGLTFSSRVTKICNRVAVALTLEANNQIQRDSQLGWSLEENSLRRAIKNSNLLGRPLFDSLQPL